MSSSQKLSRQPALILDIQSSSVRGLLVSGKNILFEIGIEISDRVTKNSKDLTENTLEAVTVIVEGILKEFILRKGSDKNYRSVEIAAIHCIVSSPWLISQAQIVSTSFRKETKITSKMITSMLENEKAKPTLHITKEGHRTGQLQVIERKVFSVMLNGYPTTNWSGRSAKTLDVSFVVSSAGTQFISKVEDICKTVTSAKQIKFHSALILHYISSTSMVPEAAAHICVHVHNEMTDIVSIGKTGNIHFASYPVGIRTITRRIAVAMGVENHTAESMLSLFANMHLDVTHSRQSSMIVERILHSWSNEYREFLKIADVSHHSPVHVFVSAEKYSKLFARLMRIPSSKVKVEPITENIYPEAINSLA